MRVPTSVPLRVILSGAKNPFPVGVVGCGVGDAPQKRNDPFHRAVEDAGPYAAGGAAEMLPSSGLTSITASGSRSMPGMPNRRYPA